MASVPPAPGAAPEVDWHGRVWRIAWPTILSNLTQPVVGAVDTGVAGHLPGPEYLGGVGVAALQRTLGMYNNQIDADVLDEGAKLKLRISPAAPRFQRFQRFAINGFNVRSTVSTFDRVDVQLTEEYTTTPLFSRAFSRSAQTPA